MVLSLGDDTQTTSTLLLLPFLIKLNAEAVVMATGKGKRKTCNFYLVCRSSARERGDVCETEARG